MTRGRPAGRGRVTADGRDRRAASPGEEVAGFVPNVFPTRVVQDGDKQIAARLGLKPHTVNEYVKRVFAHFGVSSRTELLARWVRRGWGAAARGGWSDGRGYRYSQTRLTITTRVAE